ncbi:SUKH-4 family immunity protein [Bordetella genomosp. 5]|uniref:SUKH-4 immunity protein of toxin-antitoxin system n=1 Tax=Bordetella genomosp. 5 TaxID=1395608 RepID=A0A261TI97_9BORD|nr:SUKH-4 family immunity protein [Bordetella genomosp. 5]OZI48991.1 hypothetical protein CAL25_15315 [Bordetella genomosp. 5]
MTHDDLSSLYAGGAARLDARTLADAGLDDQACAWLCEPGVPVQPVPPISLIEFVPPAMRSFGDGAGMVIAREPWGEALWLVVLPDGHVMTAGPGEAHLYVNARLENFLHFLVAYQRFQAMASVADAGAKVYSQADMQARLEAFRRGEVGAEPQAEAGFDRAAALGELERTWRKRDAAALERGAWWHRIREQLRDGLL